MEMCRSFRREVKAVQTLLKESLKIEREDRLIL
jgi:hypothetical protein